MIKFYNFIGLVFHFLLLDNMNFNMANNTPHRNSNFIVFSYPKKDKKEVGKLKSRDRNFDSFTYKWVDFGCVFVLNRPNELPISENVN